MVEKRLDRRERFGAFVLPTLQQPDEVWETAYDDATTRRRFIKLFSDSKYDLLVIVREGPDGAVLWNVLNRDRKAMNTMRTGRLVHGHGRKAGDMLGRPQGIELPHLSGQWGRFSGGYRPGASRFRSQWSACILGGIRHADHHR